MKILSLSCFLVFLSTSLWSQIITVNTMETIDAEIVSADVVLNLVFLEFPNEVPRSELINDENSHAQKSELLKELEKRAAAGHYYTEDYRELTKQDILQELQKAKFSYAELDEKVDSLKKKKMKYLKRTYSFHLDNISDEQTKILLEWDKSPNNIDLETPKILVSENDDLIKTLTNKALDKSRLEADKLAKALSRITKEIYEIETKSPLPKEVPMPLRALAANKTYPLSIHLKVSYNTEEKN